MEGGQQRRQLDRVGRFGTLGEGRTVEGGLDGEPPVEDSAERLGRGYDAVHGGEVGGDRLAAAVGVVAHEHVAAQAFALAPQLEADAGDEAAFGSVADHGDVRTPVTDSPALATDPGERRERPLQSGRVGDAVQPGESGVCGVQEQHGASAPQPQHVRPAVFAVQHGGVGR